MSRRPRLSRRTVLRGTGALISLPWLEAMLPKEAAAQEGALRRWAIFYWPMGCFQREWSVAPGADGAPAIPGFLEGALGPVASELTWIRRLENAQNGKGDHERAAGCFLTCADMQQGAGSATSADQIVADHLQGRHRIPSLVLSAPGFKEAASCCRDVEAGLNYISWRDASTPATKLQHPREVWERLFPPDQSEVGREAAELRRARRMSILDFAREDSARLARQLGASDRLRIDAYLDSVRDAERRLEGAEAEVAQCGGIEAPPAEVSFEAHTELMFEMARVGLQCDAAPVLSYIMDYEFSGRRLSIEGVRGGHHGISHHSGDGDRIEQFRRIQAWYASHFGRLVAQLADLEDVDGQPVLARTLMMLCSGMSDGNTHDRSEIPMVVAGGTAAGVSPGRALDADRPLACLFRSVMGAMGVPADRVAAFGEEGAGGFGALFGASS